MKPLLPLILFAFCIQPLFAQKETNNWLYGSFSGFTFVNGNPQPLTGVTNGSFDISTSYSDANGNLKFVFTGSRVLDRNYNVMPGSNLFVFGQGASYHIAITAASPTNANQFYIFYIVSPANQQYALRYAIVDLSLNGGLGQVISAGNLVENSVSLAFTLVQKKGTNDFWIVTHVQYTDTFHSWLVSAAGISSTPVTSQAGTAFNKADYNFADMKTSPNGEMIAGISYKYYPVQWSYDVRFVEVFNVDGQSGIITNKVKSVLRASIYQQPAYLEFSPDNRLLYAAYSFYASGLQPCGFGATNLYQFNLCYTDSITFSRYAPYIASTFSFCGMLYLGKTRLAPNKKIYMRYGASMAAINSPNIIGTHSNVNLNAFYTGDNGGNNLLPDFYHAYTQKAVINNIVYTGGCYPNPLHFKITNDTINHVEWNFGDAASGGNNISMNKEEDHVFSTPGFYTVTANLYATDGSFIETVSTLVEIKDPAKRLLNDYPKDTIFCQSQSLKLKLDVVNGVFAWYTKAANGTWNFNTLSDSFTITSSGNYMVEMIQNDCNGCRMIDSIKVTVLPSPTFSLGSDTYVCTGDSLRLSAYAPGADFLWNTGDVIDHIYTQNAGQYWVRAEYNHNGCPMSDTINISVRPGVTFSLPNDTTLCNNQTLLLNPGVANASFYSWQNSSGNSTFNVTTAGKYWVFVYGNNGCYHSDTINVSYVNAQAVYLGADTTLCAGDSVQLTANVSNINYLWSTGATDAMVTVKNSGQYWVKADNAACTVSDTISVTFNPIPFFNLGSDTLICEKNKLPLNTGILNASYLWQDGSKNNQLTASAAGQYWAQVTQQGCSYRDTLLLTTKPIPPVFIGNDTTICNNASLLLQAGNSLISNYKWHDNSSADTYLVNAQGTYWVQATGMNGCTNADTINVYKKPLPGFTLGNDTTLCEQQQLSYNFNLANATYIWSTGNTQAQQAINQPGVYWLEVSQQGCSKRDSVSVLYKPIPQVSLGNDTILCEGVSYQLNANTNNNVTYTWQNNSTGSSYVVNASGKYWVRVLLNGCANADTANITYTLKPVFDLGNDTSICKGQTFTLQPHVNDNATYKWQNGSTGSSFNVTEPGIYEVTVTNECGARSDKIAIDQGLCLLVMPNAFSPNHDGLNDVFRIKHPWYIKEFHMMIFNRWGEKVFESYDPNKGWNGTWNGIDQPSSAYAWVISLTDKDGQKDSSRGIVILAR
jgi:gliding motility-associated-like protein